MKLADYLKARRMKRIDFASAVGVSPAWITALCDETGWPSREVAEKIATATGGEVSPNDFLTIDPEPRPSEQGAAA